MAPTVTEPDQEEQLRRGTLEIHEEPARRPDHVRSSDRVPPRPPRPEEPDGHRLPDRPERPVVFYLLAAIALIGVGFTCSFYGGMCLRKVQDGLR